MLKVWLYFAQSFVAVLLTVATAVVTAQSAGDIVPGKWFVEFHGEQPNAVSISRQRFRTRLAKLPLKTRIIHEFDIWPGVVVDVTSSNRVQFMRSLLEMTFIKRVTPVRYVAPHTSTHPQLDTAPLLSTMAAANITPAPLNSHYTGSGIRVGIVDSGIDAMHPALTGLVKHGWDFITDSEPSLSRNETACMSHGTHVAGIIAMRDVNSRGLAGIAPGVTLGSYRIFGCPSSRTGSSFSISGGSGGGSVVTSEDLVLAAMNRAFKDGMHVLNLSLGGGSSWSESPVAAAASLLAKRGMVIVASAGNDGGSGMFTHSAPGLGTEVIAVGSMNVPNVKNADGKFVVTVGSAEGQRYQLDAAYSAVANIHRLYEREYSLVYVGRCCSESDLAPLQNVRSPVALAEDGGCSIHEKMANLFRYGASGLVLFNFTHASAVPQPILASNSTATGIAVAAISMVDGLYLTSTLLGGVPATIFASSKPPHIQVSGFSSAGPSPTLGLKPNIGAPGMLILSTLPSLDGKDVTYGIRSGTSMAAPYVTASVALLMEAIGIDKGADVYRRMLAHSARPVVFGTTTSGQTLYESVVRQGSGVVDVDAAVKLRDISVHPEKLTLGDSSSSSSSSSIDEADSAAWREYQLEISNNGDKPLNCQVSHWPSVSLAPFDDSSSMLVQHPRWSELTAAASILHSNVTIEPGQPSKRVSVAIQAPQLLDVSQHWIYSGYIRIACSGDYPHIHVPYLGMHGSLNSVPILDINSDMPTLHSALTLAAISHDASSTSPAASPVTVSTKDADYVVLNVRVVYPTPLLQIRVLNATDDSSLGLIADGGYHPWAGTSGNRTYQFSWDGQVIPVPKDTESETSSLGDVHSVPDGSYRLRVEALRPGSANDERLFDMWTSARFIIKH